uniref:aralkylamine N-acetyltransferase n=1 Tax=Steinernema glaseri TaxID=37863 RepID=A0A1I7Y9N4_9BILA
MSLLRKAVFQQLYQTRTMANAITLNLRGEKFFVRQADRKDFNTVVNYLATRFIVEEPHSRSVNMTVADGSSILPLILDSAIDHNMTQLVYESDGKTLAGVRIWGIGERHPKDENPWPEMTYKATMLAKLLTQAKEEFWRIIDPRVNRVLRREITSVAAHHQRKGIAKFLATYQADDDSLRKLQVQGIVSEASSLANQRLLLNQGYQLIHEIKHSDFLDANGNQFFKCDDGTDSLKVLFKPVLV